MSSQNPDGQEPSGGLQDDFEPSGQQKPSPEETDASDLHGEQIPCSGVHFTPRSCWETQLNSHVPSNSPSFELDCTDSAVLFTSSNMAQMAQESDGSTYGHFPSGSESYMAGGYCRCPDQEDNSESKGAQAIMRLPNNLIKSVCNGDVTQLKEQLQNLQRNGKNILHEREGDAKKTCLMKALLQACDKTEDIVMLLIHHAKECGDLKNLLNATYEDCCYQGQTALHIAIEKGLKDIVKILVENGADVQIPATGSFFQLNRNREDCFYFGQYPLSLAACLNQTEIVEFLLDREHKPSNPDARDYLGNTVLHALVMVADDTEKTHFVTDMYDLILKKSEEKIIEKKEFSKVNLEKLRNNEGLTPLQLAAKEGKLQLFRHILSREFPINDRMHHLSRRFVEWTYGPICTSLYDLDEVDTTDQQSALKIVVYSNKQDKYCNLLDVEPLKELIEVKWKMFAALMFGVSTAWYLHYIILFTLITALQPHVTKSESSFWLTFGKIYIFIVALGILVKTAFDTIVMWPFQLYSFLKNSYFHILFVFQSCLVVGSLLQYWDGNENFVVMQAMSLMIGWFNLLYFSRGFKFTGIYTVFIQRIILRDVSRFLCVYLMFLLGFAAALSSLSDKCSAEKSCFYHGLGRAAAELFKLTLGLGDLADPESSSYPDLFRLLLIAYVTLTCILLLNLLIALMTQTINSVSEENEKIWKMQRATTILDLERCLPRSWLRSFQRTRIQSNMFVGWSRSNKEDRRTCLRVNEVGQQNNWTRKVKGIIEDLIPAPTEAPDASTGVEDKDKLDKITSLL